MTRWARSETNSRPAQERPEPNVRRGQAWREDGARTQDSGLTLALERVQLVEERGDVDDDTGADEGGALGVDQAWPRLARLEHVRVFFSSN
jgi:hypothetical protein